MNMAVQHSQSYNPHFSPKFLLANLLSRTELLDVTSKSMGKS